MVKSFQHGIGISLVANPNYWGKKPAIKTLNFKFVPDDATRVALLETGDADIVADLPPSLAARVDRLSNAKTASIESQRRIFFFFNNNVEPTNNPLVRKAINYAVDKQSIITNLFGGHAYPLKGIFIPGELGYNAKFAGYPYNPDKAKALLKQAGFEKGLSIKLYYTINGTVLDKQTAQAVAGMLQQVGIRAQLLGGTQQAQEAVYDPGKMDGMGLWSYGPIYNDSFFLTNVASFSSTALYGSYSQDATTNRLTKAAVATTNTKKRQALYEKVQNYVITTKADWVPLYALQDIYGVNKCVNWSPRSDQNFGFEVAKTTC
jgi:peptide/nickel transport system substrate-binding protein